MDVLRTTLRISLLAVFTLAACENPTAGKPVITEAPVMIGAVEVTTPSHTVGAGEAIQLGVIVRDTRGNVLQGYAVRWESLDTMIAKVSQSGLVQAHRAGKVWITASAGDKKGGASLQVYQATLVLVPDSLKFENSEPQRLYARVSDGQQYLSGETANFAVLDTAVVKVEACGGACTGSSRGTTVIVSPRKPGLTQIIASWRGAADTALVRVLP